MTHQSPVPHLHLDRELVGTRDCYDAWREMVRSVYDVSPLSDTVTGTERVDAWLVDSLIFTDVTFSEQSFRHDHRHAENADYLSLQIYRAGLATGTIGDSELVTRPGEVHLFDFSREFHTATEISSVAGVVLPHHAIGYDPARHPPHLTFSLESAAGRFLAATFFALMGQLPKLIDSEAEILAGGFCGLLQGMVAPTSLAEPQAPKQRAERRRAIRSYLERNLSDPDLDADQICRVFSMSRSALYRDFAEFGGIAQYVTARRLEHAFGQLRSGPPVNGYVTEVAERCGFTDSGHFSRLFRKRFGLAPTAVLRMNGGQGTAIASRSQTDTSDTARLNDWFMAI
jgi:AraC-like DNA-binding protein